MRMEQSQTSSEGKKAEDGFRGNHFLLTYTIAFIHEPYNIFICPLKAGGKTLHPTTLTRPHRQADWRTGEEWASFYLAGIFARFRAIASSTAFSCFSSSSRRESVLLGLLEPEPEPVAEAEPGTAGLPNGAAGPFPDNLGGGDRGRFLRERKRSSVYIFYSCQYIQADMT